METTIDKLTRQPMRTYLADGTNDMLVGLCFLATPLQRLVSEHLPRPFLTWAYVGLIVLLGLGMWGSAALRSRVIYPLSGYMLPRQKGRIATLALALTAGVLVAILCAVIGAQPGCLPIYAFGVLYAAVNLVVFNRYGFARHLVVAFCSVAVVMWLALTHASFLDGCFRWFLIVGLVLFITGTIAFWQFVRTRPMAEMETE